MVHRDLVKRNCVLDWRDGGVRSALFGGAPGPIQGLVRW